MKIAWEEGFEIIVRLEGGAAVISANRAGLRSLANHLIALAEEAPGSHLHLDEYNALEEHSAELVLERIPERNLASAQCDGTSRNRP